MDDLFDNDDPRTYDELVAAGELEELPPSDDSGPIQWQEIVPSYKRQTNGVLERRDGKGDDFFNAHRNADRRLYTMDFDYFSGVSVFGQSGEDSLFAEYCVKGWDGRERFAYVAFFDRKRIAFDRAAAHPDCVRSRQVYLDLCRKLSASQPLPARFFYVCGESPQWQIGEFSVMTGEVVDAARVVHASTIMDVWRSLGLLDLRRMLNEWLVKRS